MSMVTNTPAAYLSAYLRSTQVHEKHGIVAKAMNDVSRDIEPYIKKKRGEAIAAVHGVK